MEQRRFMTALMLSMAFFFFYATVILPKFAQPQQAENEDEKKKDEKEPDDSEVVQQPPGKRQPLIAPIPDLEAGPPPLPEEIVVDHPETTITLGTLDPESGYFMQLMLSSEGAAIQWLKLNDPHFSELNDRSEPLKLLDPDDDVKLRTLQTSIEKIDEDLDDEYDTSLKLVNWKVESTTADETLDNVLNAVTFSYITPDGKFKLRKTYTLEKIAGDLDELEMARQEDPNGYFIDFDFTIENLSERTQRLSYELQGPIGVRLENALNARKVRDIKAAFLEDDGKIHHTKERNAKIIKNDRKGKPQDVWTQPLQFAGVDVQFFAALLMPKEDQRQNEQIIRAEVMLVKKEKPTRLSDVSVKLVSEEIRLKPTESVTHSFAFYAGPKRETLLDEPLYATKVIEYGWFGGIAKAMLWLLNLLHFKAMLPYGVAIICLTMVVRGMLYPLSRKQAISSQKMKELQPELATLKKKYGNDRQKMAEKQMELFRKHNYNPFAGCLPILFQMPIFFGLYSALNASVNLRLAEFLWIDNLAAPDALFPLPFRLPILGSDFNLLPILTIVLFIVQQKMFMPPAQNEEQELQYKIMNFMMIFMGFLFYKVPSGLCLYFIASSLWGIAERKMLDKHKQPSSDTGINGADTEANVASYDRKAPTSSKSRPGAKKKNNKGKSRR